MTRHVTLLYNDSGRPAYDQQCFNASVLQWAEGLERLQDLSQRSNNELRFDALSHINIDGLREIQLGFDQIYR
jgi:hypothetical protein